MSQEVPILMIAMQIPVLPGTTAEQVLDAISDQLAKAIEETKEKHFASAERAEAPEPVEPRVVINEETTEPFSEETKADLLASLGYSPRT